MSAAFRLARPEDLPAMLALYADLSPEDVLPDAAAAAGIWEAMLASDAQVIVAEVGSRPVATCMLLIVPNLTRGGRAFAIIENVVTLAAFRGQGIARAMLHHARDTAWAAGCYKIMLATGRTDEAVLRFYEGTGFRRGTKTFFEMRP